MAHVKGQFTAFDPTFTDIDKIIIYTMRINLILRSMEKKKTRDWYEKEIRRKT